MSVFSLTPDFNCGSVSQDSKGEKHTLMLRNNSGLNNCPLWS